MDISDHSSKLQSTTRPPFILTSTATTATVPTSTATPPLSSRTTATVPFTTAAASFTATANDIAATAAATAAKYSDRTEFRAREDGMTGSDFIKSYYIDE